MSLLKAFRKKNIKTLQSNVNASHELERSLNATQLVLLGIGAIIGAGIFVIIGPATGGHAGPAVTISFLLAALACACAGLCYAELASAIPISGSAYSYIYVAMGEIFAWLIAGMICLTYFMGSATVASGWSSYLLSFLADFNLYIPAQLADTTGNIVTLQDGTQVTALFDLPAFALVALITAVLYIGTNTSAIVNAVIVTIKMLVLIIFIIVGATQIDVANWSPYIPENTGVFGEFGISGILGGASLVIFAYSGFDVVATAAQETKNPKRDIPIGLLGALTIATLTYVAIAAVLTGIVQYSHLNSGQPIAIAADYMGMPWFKNLVKIGAVAGLPSVVLVQTFAMSRILYTMTKDGLLPKCLGKVHPKHHTPHILTLLIGLSIAFMSAMVPLENLAKIANFGTSSTFIFVCFAAMYLRYKQPSIKRSFKCPLMPIIPTLGIILFMQMLAGLSNITFIFVGVWIAILIVLYYSYGYRHSNLVHSHHHS